MEQASPAVVSKWAIRQKIWDHMEAKNLADFPRPVHHRIPNFKGAPHASARLPSLQEFQSAKTVKVNPDAPQKDIRFLTLEGSHQMSHAIKTWDVFEKAREVKVDPDKPLEGIRLAVLLARKTLLVPTPQLRTGLFNKIVPPPGATKDILRKCATSQGVRDYSVPIGLDAKMEVDLVVVGSVAVSEKGWRIGKGEGYADMEYAMMVSMGAVRQDTAMVVTAVHDCQVVDIPEELLEDHDLTVDYILTPTRVIHTGCQRQKPQGILWHKISHKMMDKIPILKHLHYREKHAGKNVALQDEQRPGIVDAAEPVGSPGKRRPQSSLLQHEIGLAEGSPAQAPLNTPEACTSLYVGNIPQGTRVSELKDALRECHAIPARLTWQGAQHRAFLRYNDKSTADAALVALQGLGLRGSALRVELAKSQHIKTAKAPQETKEPMGMATTDLNVAT